MLDKLKNKWKVNGTQLLLILCTFAIGGSLCGYLGRKVLELFEYLKQLDEKPISEVANYPIYFLVAVGRLMGFDIGGAYSAETPHLHLQEGVFASNPPAISPYLSDIETQALSQLLQTDLDNLKAVAINSQMRFNLLDWYLEFLHQHTQHFGNVRSLEILRAILH